MVTRYAYKYAPLTGACFLVEGEMFTYALGHHMMEGEFFCGTAEDAFGLNDSQLVGLGIAYIQLGLEVEFDGSRVSFGRGYFFCQTLLEIPFNTLTVEGTKVSSVLSDNEGVAVEVVLESAAHLRGKIKE
jgi:hypothetical protein